MPKHDLNLGKTLLLALAVPLATLAGCDDPPRPPPPPRPATTAPADVDAPPKKPTTQALLEGQWKTTQLSVLPLTIRVPESWKNGEVGETGHGLLMLEGYSPAGPISLRLSTRDSLFSDRFEAFLAHAKKDADSKGEAKLKFDVRQNDQYTLIERIFVEPRRAMLTVDEDGNYVEREGTPLRWSVLLFLKNNEGKLDAYELAFQELSREQYDADRDFLQKVIDSLAYDPSRKPS